MSSLLPAALPTRCLSKVMGSNQLAKASTTILQDMGSKVKDYSLGDHQIKGLLFRCEKFWV